MDYLLWRITKEPDLRFFPWIMWYIWKNRNEKVFQNKTKTPSDFLRIAEMEGTLWPEAQIKASPTVRDISITHGNLDLSNMKWCYIDGFWIENDLFTGQGWFCRKQGASEFMMGTMNICISLSPLHVECETLIWAMECMKTLQNSEVVFATDCSQLLKMVSTPT